MGVSDAGPEPSILSRTALSLLLAHRWSAGAKVVARLLIAKGIPLGSSALGQHGQADLPAIDDKSEVSCCSKPQRAPQWDVPSLVWEGSRHRWLPEGCVTMQRCLQQYNLQVAQRTEQRHLIQIRKLRNVQAYVTNKFDQIGKCGLIKFKFRFRLQMYSWHGFNLNNWV